MTRTGFDDPDPDRPERAPFQLGEWTRVGIPRDEALDWHRQRFSPDQALRWKRSEATTPLEAVRWRIAGIGPDQVEAWRDAGIDAREAVVWRELEFGAQEARTHKQAGRSPAQAYRHRTPAPSVSLFGGSAPGQPAHGFLRADGIDRRLRHAYMLAGWVDESALAWAKLGIGRTTPAPGTSLASRRRRPSASTRPAAPR